MGEIGMGEEFGSPYSLDWSPDPEGGLGRRGGLFDYGGHGQAHPGRNVDELDGWSESSPFEGLTFPEAENVGQTSNFFV